MEDLSASGFRMMDRLQGLDLHHSLLVMRTLARFQSASLVLNEQDPDCFKLYQHQIYTEQAMIQSLSPFFTSKNISIFFLAFLHFIYGLTAIGNQRPWCKK